MPRKTRKQLVGKDEDIQRANREQELQDLQADMHRSGTSTDPLFLLLGIIQPRLYQPRRSVAKRSTECVATYSDTRVNRPNDTFKRPKSRTERRTA